MDGFLLLTIACKLCPGDNTVVVGSSGTEVFGEMAGLSTKGANEATAGMEWIGWPDLVGGEVPSSGMCDGAVPMSVSSLGMLRLP